MKHYKTTEPVSLADVLRAHDIFFYCDKRDKKSKYPYYRIKLMQPWNNTIQQLAKNKAFIKLLEKFLGEKGSVEIHFHTSAIGQRFADKIIIRSKRTPAQLKMFAK